MTDAVANSNLRWIVAKAYLDAGDACVQQARNGKYRGFISTPAIFLYFRSIELALKACLDAHGVDQKELARRLGHRLQRLLENGDSFSLRAALGLTPEDEALIAAYSDYYSQKEFEYPPRLWSRQPDLDQLAGLATKIIETSRKYKPPRGTR